MPTNERLVALDGLRGAASLAVVFYHFIGFIPLLQIEVGGFGAAVVRATRYGNLGVPVFFVLSGYVIAMTASRCPFTGDSGFRFLLRRLVRIAPPYWVMVALIAAAVLAAQKFGLFRNTTISFGQVAAHLAYLHYILGFEPLDPAYWTLCLEVQFYFVFVATAVAVRKLPSNLQSLSFAILTAASIAIDAFEVIDPKWCPRLWHQFGVGVLADRASSDRCAKAILPPLLLGLVGLGVYRQLPADLAVAAVGALLTCVRQIHVVPASLLWLGKISYSLYLVHGLVGLGLGAAFRSLPIQSEGAAWLAIALATVAAIAFATVFYSLCEQRFIELSRRVRVTPRAIAAPPPERI